MDVGGELPEINTTKARVKKQQQQQQCEQPDSKRLLDPKSKKVEACDPKDTEGGRLRRCKQAGMLDSQRDDPLQQIQQQTCPNQPTRSRTQHVPSADQDLQSSKRNAIGETDAFASLPSNRGSKRSRRAARRLAYEEPQPPPLKLPKLHLVLTRKEIQDDWIKITGHKYSGKPKKSTLIQLGLGLCTSLTCPSTIRYLHDPQWFHTKMKLWKNMLWSGVNDALGSVEQSCASCRGSQVLPVLNWLTLEILYSCTIPADRFKNRHEITCHVCHWQIVQSSAIQTSGGPFLVHLHLWDYCDWLGSKPEVLEIVDPGFQHCCMYCGGFYVRQYVLCYNCLVFKKKVASPICAEAK